MADATGPSATTTDPSTAIGATLAQSRGIDPAVWSALTNSLYPGARPESVLMVLDYCKARGLDPLKRPCHIVPMEIKDARTNTYVWRDVILPGVYEHRTTAHRTGEYLGHSAPSFGPTLTYKGVDAPEWCDLVIYRWHTLRAQRIEFPVRVYFREVVTLTREGKPNARWSRAPLQMLLKCTEAAGLREAFPTEIGGEQTAEELDGARAVDVEAIEAHTFPPKPAAFDDWLIDLEAVADEGDDRLTAAWKKSPEACRVYLSEADPSRWMAIKQRAVTADRNKAATP